MRIHFTPLFPMLAGLALAACDADVDFETQTQTLQPMSGFGVSKCTEGPANRTVNYGSYWVGEPFPTGTTRRYVSPDANYGKFGRKASRTA